MKININRIIVFAFIIFILSVFLFSLGRNTVYDTKSIIGKPIDNFQLRSINNYEDIVDEQYLKKKKFTLINIWASWCKPCRDEHEFLMNLSKEKKNLQILGINFKDKKNNALKFLSELGNPYNFITEDKSGKSSVTFGVYGVPESILINNDLIIIKKFIGPLNLRDFKDISKLIKN